MQRFPPKKQKKYHSSTNYNSIVRQEVSGTSAGCGSCDLLVLGVHNRSRCDERLWQKVALRALRSPFSFHPLQSSFLTTPPMRTRLPPACPGPLLGKERSPFPPHRQRQAPTVLRGQRWQGQQLSDARPHRAGVTPAQKTPTLHQRLIPWCHMHIGQCNIAVLLARCPPWLGVLQLTSHAEKPHGVQYHFRLKRSLSNL